MSGPVASIELGSYTARLLVATLGEDGQIRPLVRERFYVRIGNDPGFANSGLLINAAQDRAIEALRLLSGQARRSGATATIAVATGVFREALNRKEFFERVKKETGLIVRLISGVEEAKLTARGALSALQSINPPVVVFDLGGGTTEFFFRPDRESARDITLSLPIGAAVLTKQFLAQDPPGAEDLQALQEEIRKILDNNLQVPGIMCKKPITVVGTGGTVSSIAAMVGNRPLGQVRPEDLNGAQISASQIEQIFDRIKDLPSSLRGQVPGLDQSRADVIIAGILGVMAIMERLKADCLYISLSDLLEGLLLDYMENSLNP